MNALPANWIEIVDAFGAGVYVLMAATHFDLWWHRRDRPSHFWLALSATGALLVNTTGALARELSPDIPRFLAVLNMLGVTLALVSLFELVQTVGQRRSGRIVRGLELAVFLPTLAMMLTGSASVAPALYLLSLGFLVAALFHAIRDATRGDPEARTLATGLVLLLATLIYDVLSELRIVARIDGAPVLGFTLLFLSAARALSTRYDREYRELVALRADLEQRVATRTAALGEANLQLGILARTDALTGLANRRSFVEQVNALAAAHRGAILMIDIDHFKRINDGHGHDIGDATLRAVAATLRDALRPGDVLARWGGEEFIALLPDRDCSDALGVAESLRSAIAGVVVAVADGTLALTASIGVATHTATQALDDSIRNADRALYQAKQQGRNRVVAAVEAHPSLDRSPDPVVWSTTVVGDRENHDLR